MRISDWSSDVCSSDLALDDQEGVERADGGADVAQQLHAGLEDERSGPQGLPVLQAVVALVGLGEAGVATAGAEVERAAVDDDPAHRVAMPAEELGGRVDDDVGAPLDRADEVRGGDGVVDYERHVALVGDAGHAARKSTRLNSSH